LKKNKETILKTIVFALLTLFFVDSAFAQNACEMKAADKKLNGAAKNSFVKKCEKDVRSACESDDVSKRTSGAAKEAHIKKCVKDNLNN
jgi:hypothetical protein